jgi:hypothetical protein
MNCILSIRESIVRRILSSLLIVATMLFLDGCKSDETTEPTPTPVGSAEVEPNDITANELGTLGTTALAVSGVTSGATDIDRFVVTVAAGTNLNASVSWQGSADLDLGFLDAQGIVLNYQRTTANPERCTLANRPAGRYILEVATPTSANTSYTLTITAK